MKWIALLCLAYLQPAVGGAEQDEKALLEQVRLHPESFLANHLLGEFYIQRHQFGTAIPYLERARQIDPADYDNAYDLALAAFEAGLTVKSREVVVTLLARQEKAELHNLLGDIEEKDGHVQ